MMEQLKRYWEIAKLALLQEKAAKDIHKFCPQK